VTDGDVGLDALRRCFEGAIPAVLATASAGGIPNITYLSKAHAVDAQRVALSNQFFSKTARNLAENPRASLLLIDPTTHDEFRLDLAYERTDRRGPVFEQLRADIDALAALTGMQDVFRLRAADIYRVLHVGRVPANPSSAWVPIPESPPPSLAQVAELCARIGRCTDLDALVEATVDGLDRLLGYRHVLLLLADEQARRLYTMASRGFDAEHVGAEVALGDGIIGVAAERGTPVRIGNLKQATKYSATVRRSFVATGVEPGRELPVPTLPDADSRIVAPAVAAGELVGALVADRVEAVAFGDADEAALAVVAGSLAGALVALRSLDDDGAPAPRAAATAPAAGTAVHVRHFAVDGSTFLDGDYLIKGVAGRILWSLLRQHAADGRTDFTNRELRLDPTLELPGYKDNLESRLILLKRRLDEREAAIRLTRTGRGRFRLDVAATVQLELA
jgi:predicted pyridoxine 5'-phosphate oxidase superfamily flavin-nucleotide-binding protein